MTEIELTTVEAELCRLPAVQVARIVGDRDRITEVHIIASPTKPAKRIVRDVQSVALATFGLELDHRIVSVVQLGQNGDGGTADEEWGRTPMRLRLGEVIVRIAPPGAVAEVTIRGGDDDVRGTAEGTSAAAGRHRLVARATLDSLRQLDDAARAVDVLDAHVTRVGNRDVAIVTVVFVSDTGEHIVSGSAIVRAGDDSDALGRAVLDATNRRLESTAR